MPRNRSALTLSVTPPVPQSTRPRCLLDRHDQQTAIHRHVTLTAGTDDRGEQPRLGAVLDVVGVESLEVADEEQVAAEREIRVGEGDLRIRIRRRTCAVGSSGSGSRAGAAGGRGAWRLAVLCRRCLGRRDLAGWGFGIEEAFRLGQRRHELHVPRGLTGRSEARRQSDTGIGPPAPVRSGRVPDDSAQDDRSERSEDCPASHHFGNSSSIALMRSISMR